MIREGDLVRGNNAYGITNEKSVCEVLVVRHSEIKVRLLYTKSRDNQQYIGCNYWVDKKDFEKIHRNL